MKVKNMVPEIYYRESRDFAYIGRVFELMFNYMKTGADNINILLTDKYISSNLLDLYANTLGFDPKHKYDDTDLYYILSGFSKMMKHKGSIDAVKIALQLMFNSQKISNTNLQALVSIDPTDRYNLIIKIPETFSDVILLEDLFDYILPTGFTYRFENISDGLPEFISETIVSTYIRDNDQDSKNLLINNVSKTDSAKIRILQTSIGDDLNTDESKLFGHIGQINTSVIPTSKDSENRSNTQTESNISIEE